MHAPVTEPDRAKLLETQLLAHHDAFLAFVRRRVADPDLAEDVLQDSLLKALRASATVRNNETIVAWFYRILRRTIIDLYRHRAVERKAIDEFGRDARRVIRPTDEPAVCRCLQLLLPTLRPQYASLIQKLDLEGVPAELVASRLGITPNNLKVRLHRARHQLRERLVATCNICATHRCLHCDCESSGSDPVPRSG